MEQFEPVPFFLHYILMILIYHLQMLVLLSYM
jgi:hypothetical protein